MSKPEAKVELKHICQCGALHVVTLTKLQLDYLRSACRQSETKKKAMLMNFKYQAMCHPGFAPSDQSQETQAAD